MREYAGLQGKARVGLVLMHSDWGACPDRRELGESVQSDTKAIVDHLENLFELAGWWVVDSPETLHICQQALRGADIDMLLLAYQSWSDDTLLVALLQALEDHPMVLWCYMPWRRLPRPIPFREVVRGSGAVGAFSALGTLRNLDVPFLFTWGAPDDPRLIHDLNVAGRAARARQALRSARFGVIPASGERKQLPFIDDFRLLSDFGPSVQYLPVSAYKRAIDAVEPDQVSAYLDLLRKHFVIQGVQDETLSQAARAALGFKRLADDHQLDVLSANDDSGELWQAAGLRPALYPDLAGADHSRDVLYQPENDLGAATANFILHFLTGSPTLFFEMWFWDQAKNQVIGGHPGFQNPELAEPGQRGISKDYSLCRPEGCEGAQHQMVARSGRVTLFQLRSTPTGWQAIAVSGVCLEGQPYVEGYPHAILRLDTPIEHFLNKLSEVGSTQNWLMAYGSVLDEIDAFCQMEKLPLEVLTY